MRIAGVSSFYHQSRTLLFSFCGERAWFWLLPFFERILMLCFVVSITLAGPKRRRYTMRLKGPLGCSAASPPAHPLRHRMCISIPTYVYMLNLTKYLYVFNCLYACVRICIYNTHIYRYMCMCVCVCVCV